LSSSDTQRLFDHSLCFIPKNGAFSGYCVEEGKIKKNKNIFNLSYFVNDYLGDVKLEKMKTPTFTGHRI
jgi:hypothetical protein